jgi:hypothetical protein
LPFRCDASALAQFGHDRDDKGKRQIVFGLLCTAEGCPVAVAGQRTLDALLLFHQPYNSSSSTAMKSSTAPSVPQ